MYHANRFFKSLMWAGVATAVLTGCNQQPTTESPESTDTSTEVKKVAITAFVEHPALNAVRDGVIEQLEKDGFVKGENLEIDFQSAQNNSSNAGQIAKQFVGDEPDVIVAIATPSAQSVAAVTNTIPIVFSAVTDPVEAKLVDSLDGSGTNVTGASDALPYEPQIDLMNQLIPDLKNVGYVYSPGEVNSTIVLKNLTEKLKPMGITVHSAPAQKSNDIAMAARSIADKVDVIYTSTDNNVVSAYESLYQAARESGVPLIASDTDSVARGAVAALGVNYHDLGIETGKIVAKILNGEDPGTIPVYTASSLNLHVNKAHAQEVNIDIPQELLDSAKVVSE